METLSRLTGSMVLSSGITFSLFWLMTTLIVVEGKLVEVDPTPSIEIVRVLRVERSEPIDRRMRPMLAMPQSAPTLPRVDDGDVGDGIEVAHRGGFEAAEIVDGRGLLGGMESADGEAMALVRVAPTFPERALALGLEGRVLIEFDISPAGTVMNARVIASEPTAIFDEAALQAVRQWRYDPKVVAGKPVAQRGLRIAIPFRRAANVGP